MNYNHIMMLSEEKTVENTGYSQLFEQYPPNKILLFAAGPSAEDPALIQSTAGKEAQGDVYFQSVTPINDSLYDNKEQISELAFIIYSEFFNGIKNHLPDQFTKNPENPLIITLSSGSSLHRSILMSVGIGLGAKFATIRRVKSENKAIVKSHDWISEGFSTNLGKTGQKKDVLARNVLRAMLIFRSENSLFTDRIFSGEMTPEETINICSSDGVLPTSTGFSSTATRLIKEGLLEIVGEQKSIILHEIDELSERINDSGEQLSNNQLIFQKKKLALQKTYGFDFDLIKNKMNEDDIAKQILKINGEHLQPIMQEVLTIREISTTIQKISTELNSLTKQKKKLLIQKYPETKYRLTSKGWMVALRQLREALDYNNNLRAPLEGISKENHPDLVDRYMLNEGPHKGIILGVRAYNKLNSTSPISAIGMANSLLSGTDSVISLFIRDRDGISPSLNFDSDFSKEDNPLNSIWREEDGEKFEKYYNEWFGYLDQREVSYTTHWALFDAPSDQMEESFRLFCEWLWPRISSQIQGGVPNWKCDITQLGREQQLCAVLFSTMYNLPLTWTKKRRGEVGTRREVPMSNAPTSDHIVYLPISLISRIVPTSNDFEFTQDLRVLVGLLIHEEKCEEAKELARLNQKEDPFTIPDDSEIELRITLNDLSKKIRSWVESGEYTNKYLLTSSEQPVHSRVVKQLYQEGLIDLTDVKQKGGGNKLQLTRLGKLLAMSTHELIQGR